MIRNVLFIAYGFKSNAVPAAGKSVSLMSLFLAGKDSDKPGAASPGRTRTCTVNSNLKTKQYLAKQGCLVRKRGE